MIHHAGREPDRRRHLRIEPKGTVTLHALGNAHRGRLVNLGSGGMYVATEITLPDRLLARMVGVELRLDGPLAVWQSLVGRVSRIAADGVAVVFDAATTPALLRMIDELTTASHANARVVSVVLIDQDLPRRAAMAEGFRAAGCDVVEVGTQLEAIVRLGESDFEPDIIAVASTEPATTAHAMGAFVEHFHPSSMLVTIGPGLGGPDGLANWLSDATASADLPTRILELLFAPRGR